MSINYTYSSYFNPIQQLHEDEEDEEEEYIDMEITSFYTAFLHHHHHHQSKDFEFPLHSSGPLEPRQLPATSPADELFFNGKLLPLQPHPNRDLNYDYDPNYDQPYSTPLATTPVSGTTPFQSCNVSPATSCHVSRELTPEDYFSNGQEIITSSNCTINNDTKKSNWAKKLKLIKPRSSSLLTSKIKASKSYFKSLFGIKSNSCKINDNPRNGDDEKMVIPHRMSFSGAFRPSKAKTVSPECSSSSSSSVMLKRSNSLRVSEIESSVDGAIAHCKQSQSHRALKSWKKFGAIRFEACQE